MNAPVQDGQAGIFTTGSTLRHVAVMTATGSIGLIAIFLVDFLSLLYVSWLGNPAATAGVGFATIVLFFTTSVNIGLMIGISAVTSRALGAGDRGRARRLGGSATVLMLISGTVVTAAAWPFLPQILRGLGASGETFDVALRFLHITLPSNLLMALGMGFSATLRAVGDAKRAMYVTLAGGIVTAGLDPLLIFVMGLGTDGAAYATVVSRLCFAVVGWHGAVMVHDLVARPQLADVKTDIRPLLVVAGPAILTNLATPIANAFVTAIMARFGDKAIAALAIIDRIVPVAFGVLFAMSGAIGPILGQNWGARRFDRMRGALTDSVWLAGGYIVLVWLLLVLGRNQLAALFGVTGLAEEIVVFFCLISGPMWLSIGLLFVANSAFNNLGFPLYSTAFNWGRATLGTVPLAWLGAEWDGPRGLLVGLTLGASVFGATALWTAYRAIARLRRAAEGTPAS